MKRRFVAALLSVCMISATLAGCSNTNTGADNSVVSDDDSSSSKKDNSNPQTGDSVDYTNSELMSNITGFAAGSGNLDYTYTDPQYGLAEDYVFEFDASDEAGAVAFDAFKVYVSEDDLQSDIDCLKENGYHSSGYYCDSSYEGGKIKVSPTGVINLAGTYQADPNDDPTWGIYNRLFLAQWIDLETGEELDEPIVTIFSINHGMDAPVVSQILGENNVYTLTWEPINGANEYSVYVMLDDKSFS